MNHTYWLRLRSMIVLVGILGSCGRPDTGRAPASLTLVASLSVGSPVYHIAWSADSTLLAVRDGETIQVWDAAAHQIVTTYRGHRTYDIDFDLSPDGTFIVSSDDNGWIARWDPRSGIEQWRVAIDRAGVPEEPELWYSVAVSADQQRLLVHDSGWGWILDASTGQLEQHIPMGWGERHPTDGAVLLRTIPHGPYDGFYPASEELVLWNMQTNALHQRIVENVGILGFSPSGRVLFFVNQDTDTFNIWDVASAQIRWSMDTEVYEPAFSSEDMYLATSNAFGTGVTIRRVSDGSLVRKLDLSDERGGLNRIAFSPDRELLLTARGDGQELVDGLVLPSSFPIGIWRVADGTRVQELTDHADAVNTLVWSPDGTLLASGSSDDTIKLWRFQP